VYMYSKVSACATSSNVRLAYCTSLPYGPAGGPVGAADGSLPFAISGAVFPSVMAEASATRSEQGDWLIRKHRQRPEDVLDDAGPHGRLIDAATPPSHSRFHGFHGKFQKPENPRDPRQVFGSLSVRKAAKGVWGERLRSPQLKRSDSAAG
jgi:hypothetical protein